RARSAAREREGARGKCRSPTEPSHAEGRLANRSLCDAQPTAVQSPQSRHTRLRATFFIVGWAWEHRYAPLLFAAAPIAVVVGLVLAPIALRRKRAALAALVGGGLCLLVLLGYALCSAGLRRRWQRRLR